MYNLELKRAKKLILENKPRTVLLQLPDGLKPNSKEIVDYLKSETDSQILVWAGSCFGACDYPYYAKDAGVDMIIAWGHSEWKN